MAPVALVAVAAALSITAIGLTPMYSGNQVTLCGALPVGSTLPDGGRLSAEQVVNASVIVSVAQQTGAGTTGAVDAVDAAFTESRLVNVPGGTSDSLGLFQERPSQGWGTPTEILDPIYATEQFLRRLVAVGGWLSMPPATAAQAVERSAFPGRYQQWVAPATLLVAGLSGSGACSNGDGSGPLAVAVPAGYTLPAGTPGPVAGAISFALAQLGKPYVWGGIGPAGYDCSGLTMQAYHASGIAIPRTTYTQVYAGQPVYTRDQLAPGDLLFTEGSDPGPAGAPGHVGMYIGSGMVIDAPHTGANIELSSVAGWIGQVVAIRRIVPG